MPLYVFDSGAADEWEGAGRVRRGEGNIAFVRNLSMKSFLRKKKKQKALQEREFIFSKYQ